MSEKVRKAVGPLLNAADMKRSFVCCGRWFMIPCMFSLDTCTDAARHGAIGDWVTTYLSAGYWANSALRDGLLMHPRRWIGPLSLELAQLQRCCGPEPEMTYQVPTDVWNSRVSTIAEGLQDAKDLPPLILEWLDGKLMVRDGSHRYGAMLAKGWTHGYGIVWCNSEVEHQQASAALDQLNTERR